MLRSKDTWGECNGKYDENYFGSFSPRNFKNPSSCQVILVSYSAAITYSCQEFDRNECQYRGKRQNKTDFYTNVKKLARHSIKLNHAVQETGEMTSCRCSFSPRWFKRS